MKKLIVSSIVMFSLLTACSQPEPEVTTTEQPQDHTELIMELEEYRANEAKLIQREKDMDMYEIKVMDMSKRLDKIEGETAILGDMVDSYFYGDGSQNDFEDEFLNNEYGRLPAIIDEFEYKGIMQIAYYYDIFNEDSDGYISRYHITKDLDTMMYNEDQSEEGEEPWSYKDKDELFNQLSKENYLELKREGLY